MNNLRSIFGAGVFSDKPHMTKGIILAIILQCSISTVNFTQESFQQLSITRGLGYTKLQDQLWGNQIYKGTTTQNALNFEWRKKQHRWNQLSLTFGSGKINVPNSIRENTDSFQLGLTYQHLHRVATFEKTKINWAVGGGLSTFVEFRVHNQYAQNNAASYDLGSSLQLQNRFYKSLLLKNGKQLRVNFLVETALLTAYLRPGYASSLPEEPLDVTGLGDVTIGDVTSRMRWGSIPAFFRMNMYTTIDYLTCEKFGFRLQYNWYLLNVKQKVTSVSHQVHIGLFFKFGKKDVVKESTSKIPGVSSLNLRK